MRTNVLGSLFATAGLALLASLGSALAVCVDYATTPKWLAGLDTPGQAVDLVVAGNLAYIADGPSGLRIHDVSDPANPQLAGFLDTPGNAWGVAVSGSYAYVADGATGLRVIDVANPASPQLAGFVDTPGFAAGVAVAGEYAYVADGANGLHIISIANPASPAIVGSLDTPGYADEVAISGSHAYVADGASGLRAIDISNPASPVAAGSFDTPGNAVDLAISGGHALVADGPAGLRVISIANPASLQGVGFAVMPWFVTSVAAVNDVAWVTDGPGGVLAIDIANPAAPVITGSVGLIGAGVAIAGTYVHVAGGNLGHQTIDATFHHSPTPIGKLDTPGIAQGVSVSGNYAYVADGDAGLRVIDVSNPASPVFTGVIDTPGHAWAVEILGSYAYVADQATGLLVVDIANPASPQIVGTATTPGLAVDVAVVGSRAFVADYDQGMQVLDISNPASPQIVGSAGTPPGFSWGLDATVAAAAAAAHAGVPSQQGVPTGPLVYRVEYDGNEAFLEIRDTSLPGNPIVGDLLLDGDPLEVVWVNGGRAFVLFADGDIDIVDVTDPENPQYLDSMDLPGISYDLGVADGSGALPQHAGEAALAEVSDPYAYVANELGGVQVVRFANDVLELIGSINTGDARGVFVGPGSSGSERLVYVANGTAGLAIVPTQCSGTTGVGEPGNRATRLDLRVFPNPGLSAGVVRFALVRTGPVRVTVHDIAGREIRELFRGTMKAGDHALAWDRRDRDGRLIAPGVYHLRVASGEGVATTRYVSLR